MKKKTLQKFTAAVMAFALIGGALPAGSTSLFGSPSIVKAATIAPDGYDHVNDPDHLDNYDPAIFDEKTGVLTLNGKVNYLDVRKYVYTEKRDEVKKVYCAKGTVFPANCSHMFGTTKVESFDFSNADTSNVTDMSYMFECSRKVESIDLSSFNTSNVTDMSYMFTETDSLVSLDLSNWDTSNVTDMSYMFCYAKKLKSLDLKHFNTSNVRTMECMFGECNALESLDISKFNTSNVKTMENMFMYCRSLTSLDVSSFDTSKTEILYRIFYNCSNLASLDVTNFDTSAAESNDRLYGMLLNCDALYPDIVHYSGTNIALDGRIEAVFHIYEKGYWTESSSDNLAKIVMSGPNGDIVITDLDALDVSNRMMKCVYPLNATQANEKVTLKAYDKNGKQLILCKNTYELCNHSQVEASVYDYLTVLKDIFEYKYDAKLEILVNAIENYCKAAENYFKGAENEVKEYKDEYAITVAPFAPEFGNDVKISLVLDSATAVRIYTNASGVKIDGEDITPKTTKYGKCYEISNIPAHKLLERHTLTIGDKNYKFSPMSYVYRTVNSGSASELLKNTAWAAYLYANAANAYIK
ncbi:BspA family leucine-rich repeat surface protein [Ruminococcus sp.]